MHKRFLIIASVIVIAVLVAWLMRDKRPTASALLPESPPAQDRHASNAAAGILPQQERNHGIDSSLQRAARPAGEAPEANTSATEESSANAVTRPAQLRWEGPSIAKAGSPFTVTLRMTSDAPVRVVPLQLQFDPALLELVSLRAGDFFGNIDSGSFGYRVNRPGSIRIGASARAPSTAADSALIVATFKPLKPATLAELHISALHLEGPGGFVAYENVMPFVATVTP